jgi:putative holliday junction resolvase
MSEQGRVMCLDVGTRRVGVALSDLLRITAQPHATLDAEPLDDLITALMDIARRENVTQIVVGLPKRLDGSQGDSASAAKDVGTLLKSQLELPVRYWDERFSTQAAQRALLEGDMRRKKRKQVIDRTAAAWILQGYLDSQLTP